MSQPPGAHEGEDTPDSAAGGTSQKHEGEAEHRLLDPDRAAEESLDPEKTAEHRLDPDRAAAEALSRGSRQPPPPAIDTRPYKWMIGIFGLILVIAASVYQFARTGGGSVGGVTAGNRLHYFVAPLAGAGRALDANTRPRCDPAHPNPQGLNVCGRRPLVLAFFVPGSTSCVRQVDALQELSRRYRGRQAQFAAVAIRSSQASTATLVRAHHWTIPVAYDRDGAVGTLYAVDVCPVVELAHRGGVVADRLIGEKWSNTPALARPVARLLRG
ncbi:MAG: redoxin domain-containing protein [Solirubrobacterales bacterium]|nr:redoxin domain-containing protein [Solirubrobacterales bacterium]